MPDPHAFARAAVNFCEWVQAPPDDASRDAVMALELLVTLYDAALALEVPDDYDDKLDGHALEEATWRAAFERFGVLPFNYYAAVANPHMLPPGEPVTGDIADDLADIYRDLSIGLSLYHAGHESEAMWTWVDSFRAHWGRHAVDAIKALHAWFERTGEWG